MDENEIIVRVAGAAGDGVQSAGLIFSKTFSRSGLNVVTYNYYQDIVRGGQSWYQIRASHNPVRSQGDGLDVLVALNRDGLERHTNPEINEGGASPLDGIAIFDESISPSQERNVTYCKMPLSGIASKHSKVSLVKNTVAIGAAVASLGIEFDVLAEVIKDTFGNKGAVADQNVNAAREGYDYYVEHYKPVSKKVTYSGKKRVLINGGEAVGLGAVSGGLKMYIAYPMTPASSCLHFLAAHSSKYDVFVKIPEDEISAITMAIGANYAGVRAMTGSSGGGFSLMVEALGMAGMLEIPLVVYESQRSGPSTGLPTKTEQGDLNLVLGASQGDFPRIILAPGTVEECFYMTREAMNLAQVYQTPVIVMSDLYLSEHVETVPDLELEFELDDGKRAADNEENYRRYLITEDGISPRAFPGQSGLMHNEDSDEHDEYGNVVSDAETDPRKRIAIMEKRMRKLDTYKSKMKPTHTYRFEDADVAIVQWGSTKGVVEEAIDVLRKEGIKAGAIEVSHVFPLNPDIRELMSGKKVIVVENNFSGQFNRLLKSEFLVKTEFVNKFNGEAFYPGELAAELKAKIKGGA
ncbi:MAG: 2-oxoacid:acceptor oxidoreductase subunit alpha [Candidatus Thermoplasmatota archaeon]|nr:2-oxoacid:acceptor oxidoreductase subunit alpha [Candidatus Thermoplasmatota archaeon]